MPWLFRLAFLAAAQSWSAPPDFTTSPDFSAVVRELRQAPDYHEFRAPDGTRLAYAVYNGGQPNAARGPLVVAEGKGESALRYAQFADEMGKRGYGPIYVLDHRAQGFSESALPGAVHVEHFESYVDDFTRFLDGPVQEDLARRGITQKPGFVAHSMGAAIADLALRKRPDLTGRIAYVSPMFRINAGDAMAYFNDKPVELLSGLLRGTGFGKTTFGVGVDSPPNPGLGGGSGLRASYDQERRLGIRVPRFSVDWINESMHADDQIMAPGSKPVTPAIIFQGKDDTIVRTSAMSDYACDAGECALVQLPGGHALHQERDSVRGTLEEQLDRFFQGKPIQAPPPGCEGLYSVLRR